MPITWPIKGIFAGTSGGSLGSIPLRLSVQTDKAMTDTAKDTAMMTILPLCTSTTTADSFEAIIVTIWRNGRVDFVRFMVCATLCR